MLNHHAAAVLELKVPARNEPFIRLREQEEFELLRKSERRRGRHREREQRSREEAER